MAKQKVVLPVARELFGGDTSVVKRDGEVKPKALLERSESLVKAMTRATVDGVSGQTYFGSAHETGAPLVKSRRQVASSIRSELEELGSVGITKGGERISKTISPSLANALAEAMADSSPASLAKEWSLTNPISTGLVPFDLEAPAKLLTPRPTPLRNSIPRLRGQGAARRFKVISGFTGTGTGGATTLNGGINESTTNAGPGGLSYVRPPYISYDGYDVVLSYVSWGLSDSVSWQAEFQGQGFEDIRSLSNTALLYATMLMDERLMLYGRGTTGNGYAGALAAASISSAASTAASNAPGGSSTLSATTYYVCIAADAGDLLGTTGAMHQGPTSGSASVAVGAGNAIKINIDDVSGALGYNLFIASVAAGPYFYAGRTGYNVGYITAPPNASAASVSPSGTDNSAISTNFDGLLTNLAASGGYTTRLNSTFSTSTPGIELQTMFSSLYDSVKADPDEIWLNGHDRNQLSNALLAGNNVNNYTVYIPDSSVGTPGVTVGALVQGIVNQITGKELRFNVHPWMPQGNLLVRSVTLPIPDSNVSETSVMALAQDYVAIQWPAVQFTYDASTLEIGTMCHYAPGWSGLIQGIEQDG